MISYNIVNIGCYSSCLDFYIKMTSVKNNFQTENLMEKKLFTIYKRQNFFQKITNSH